MVTPSGVRKVNKRTKESVLIRTFDLLLEPPLAKSLIPKFNDALVAVPLGLVPGLAFTRVRIQVHQSFNELFILIWILKRSNLAIEGRSIYWISPKVSPKTFANFIRGMLTTEQPPVWSSNERRTRAGKCIRTH